MDGSGEDRAERRKRIATALAATLAFVIGGVVFAPDLATRKSEPEAKPPRPLRAAETSAPTPPSASLAAGASGAASAPDSFDCMIAPHDVVDVGSDVRGRIDAIEVERGDYVEAGQVLARLESGVEQAAVRAAAARAERLDEIESSETNLELGRKRRARARQLFERKALSLDARDEVETKTRLAALEVERAHENRRVAKIQLEQAQADLDRRTIRSPLSGYVVERLMSPGEVVDEEPLLRIAQVDPLRVDAILPSEQFGRTHSGGRARVVPEAPLDAPRDAEVTIVDPVLDGASGTFGVRLRLPNPQRDLPAGLRCRVSFEPLDDGATPVAQR
jgi:RND family efflux transporter MFP subunit